MRGTSDTAAICPQETSTRSPHGTELGSSTEKVWPTEAIREAIHRNIKSCGRASDTPYYHVQEAISYWYYCRHLHLVNTLYTSLTEQENERWRTRYAPVWLYRVVKR